MSGDQIDTSPLIEEPAPITALSDIDLEEGNDRQVQCPKCRKIDEAKGAHSPFFCEEEQKISWIVFPFATCGIQLNSPCKCKGTSKYVHRKRLDDWPAVKKESEIDLEEGCDWQIQSPICRETDGGYFIAPSKFKGTSKYVHRERLDRWRAEKQESEIDLEEGGDRQIQSPKYRETDGGDFIAHCKSKGTSEYVHRERLDRWRAEKQESEINLEEGRDRQIQCPICRETYGGYFIAPSKFKGTSKYVHRERLDRWRAEKQESEIDHEEGRDRQIQCPTCRDTYGGYFIAPSMFKGTSKYVHREHLDRCRAEKQETLISKLPRNNLAVKCSEKMSGDQIDPSPLIAPPLITVQSEIDPDIDCEKGCDVEIQCRICLKTAGDNFIAPCKCRGISKYVHRKCLDQWRAEKEGYAFSQCETCKAPYYLKVHTWRRQKLKFRIFVARDILFVFIVIQLVIGLLAYMAYLIDDWQKFRLRLTWGFGSELSFYYICGAILFLALLGLSGCIITCFDPTVRNDPAQPCREFCHCCCNTGVLVTTVVGQLIWRRHYHILQKTMLTKVYVVQDVGGKIDAANWSPPPLKPEHVEELKKKGLLPE